MQVEENIRGFAWSQPKNSGIHQDLPFTSLRSSISGIASQNSSIAPSQHYQESSTQHQEPSTQHQEPSQPSQVNLSDEVRVRIAENKKRAMAILE
jgi:hypothetical protein